MEGEKNKNIQPGCTVVFRMLAEAGVVQER